MLMYCGAVVFAWLENPEVFDIDGLHEDRPSNGSQLHDEVSTVGTTGINIHSRNVSLFWETMEIKFNVKVICSLQPY